MGESGKIDVAFWCRVTGASRVLERCVVEWGGINSGVSVIIKETKIGDCCVVQARV